MKLQIALHIVLINILYSAELYMYLLKFNIVQI